LTFPRALTLNPVSKNRLHEAIAEQIQRKILKGDLKTGDKLPTERELALELNVNRATVREALKKLEALDLLRINHGDGIYVKNYLESGNLEILKSMIYLEPVIPAVLMGHLLEIRRILVPEMCAAAALRRSEKDIAAMSGIISPETGLDISERDLRLHQAIALAGGNTVYVFVLNFFNQAFRDFGGIYFSNEENVRVSEKFHNEIVRSVADGDAFLSRALVADVLKYTEERIMEAYSGAG